MIHWLTLALPLVAAVGLIAVLGLPIAFALRLRGYLAIVTAVPAALSIIAIASVVAPMVGLSWGILLPLVFTVALTVILAVVARWIRPQRPVPFAHRQWIVPLASAAIGGAAIAATIAMSIKSPDAISQTYDANFHLNAVRQILDTGSASPFDMDLSAPGSAVFYPTLWHSCVALIVGLTGASIPLATNAMVFVVCCIVWPIGMVALGRAIAGPSARVSVISGILSAAFPSFPLALVGYGVLYPNLLSIALVPFAAVGLLQVLALARSRSSERSSALVAWLLLLGGLGAATFAHPNAIHILILWAAAPVVAAAVRAFRGRRVAGWDGGLRPSHLARPVRLVCAVAAVPLLLVTAAGAWYVGRTFDNPWGGQHNLIGAFRDAIGMTPHLEGHAWPVTILLVLGIVVVWRNRPLRWLLASATLLLLVYLVADGFPPSAWRTLILSPWYSDPWRISALVWLGAFPVVLTGASAVWTVARVGLGTVANRSGRPRAARVFAIVTAACFLLAATQGAGAFAGTRYVSDKYVSNDDAPLLSDDERELISRLGDHLPEDAIIIDNPWNGGALAYALSGFPVLTPHTGGEYDPRIEEITLTLSSGDPKACSLAHELGAIFVLDFGDHFVFEGTPRAEPYEGITAIEDSPVLTEIDREGDAVLYKLTGC